MTPAMLENNRPNTRGGLSYTVVSPYLKKIVKVQKRDREEEREGINKEEKKGGERAERTIGIKGTLHNLATSTLKLDKLLSSEFAIFIINLISYHWYCAL